MGNVIRSSILLLALSQSGTAWCASPGTTTTISPYTSTTITPTTVFALKPEITGYGHTGCINKGSKLTILGKNFGSQKGVSLGGHGINVNLPVASWTTTRVVVNLPNDSRIHNNEWYYTGIKDPKTGNWLSNINKNITICAATISPTLSSTTLTMPKTTIATTPTLKLGDTTDAPAGSSPGMDPTPATATAPADDSAYSDYYGDSGYDSGSWQDYGGYGPEPATPTVLPNSSGSLIDRQLPPPPPNLALAQKQANFIEKHTEPNELIVISGDMNQARQLAQQLGGYGLAAKRRKVLKNLGLVITTFRVPAGADMPELTRDVRQANPNMWVDMNHRYQLMAGNRDTAAAKEIVRWEGNDRDCGKGLRIGLVDTGVDTNHPALKSQKIIDHSVLSHGIKKATPDHGTAIAALLVGSPGVQTFTGLLPGAKLFSVAVFRQRDERHSDTTAEWIISAIDWLLSQKVQVINMSLGGPRNLLVDVAIQRTIKSGVPVIAAAGNNGPRSAPVYPAAQPGVIAVTAVDAELNLYSKASQGNYIDFAAPGVDIWTASGSRGGKFVAGTSFAVPFVTAGIATLAQSKGPRKAYEALSSQARDLGTQGKDDAFGWGLLQVARACR